MVGGVLRLLKHSKYMSDHPSGRKITHLFLEPKKEPGNIRRGPDCRKVSLGPHNSLGHDINFGVQIRGFDIGATIFMKNVLLRPFLLVLEI